MRNCSKCKCMSCSRCACKMFTESAREYKRRLQTIPVIERCVSCEMCGKNGFRLVKDGCATYKKGVDYMAKSENVKNSAYLAVEKVNGEEFAKRAQNMAEMGGFSFIEAAEFLTMWNDTVSRLRRSGADLSRIRLKGVA